MNTLQEYKPITLVFYIDWNWERNALPLDDSKKEAILERQNKYKVDCLEIGFEPIIRCYDVDDIVAFKCFIFSAA